MGTPESADWHGVVARIGHVATAAPDSPAVCAGDRSLTFGALWPAAGRLATALLAAGAGPEVPVAVCLPRGCERIVATLAIWQAGAAVLALDPAWPVARLRALLDDAAAPVALAEASLAPALAQDGRCVLTLDGLAAPARAIAPAAPVAPDTLAYIVYTSGSTGGPKGVEITHANLCHLIDWHLGAFAVTAADRASHLSGLGFDAAFWDVWPALCAGAAVVLADDTVRTSPSALRRWLLDQRITTAYVPTALAAVLMTQDWPATAALRWLLTGGEALHARPRAGLPFAVVNNYGPCECTVVATSGVVTPDGDGPPDIGRAIAGARVELLDTAGAPAREGEIVIGGLGVGRGYRSRPALTAERFSPAGWYRTGDLARRLPDGRLLFLGRLDTQEQIRGVRVEPEEVAAALGRHAQVAWCAVVGHGAPDQRRLAAYVLPAAGALPSAPALRGFLAHTLPEAMLPAAFVRLDHVPLSPNGKLDRDALPPPETATLLPAEAFRAPQTPTEIRLAGIIGGLLGGVAVGADDNFFLLGGHSLLGTQVVLRAREAFGVQLSLRDLFEAPTVAELAERVAELLVEALDGMSEAEAEQWAAT